MYNASSIARFRVLKNGLHLPIRYGKDTFHFQMTIHLKEQFCPKGVLILSIHLSITGAGVIIAMN